MCKHGVAFLRIELNGTEVFDAVGISATDVTGPDPIAAGAYVMHLFTEGAVAGDADFTVTFNVAAAAATVPVPAGGVLFLTGLAGFAGLRRLKRG